MLGIQAKGKILLGHWAFAEFKKWLKLLKASIIIKVKHNQIQWTLNILSCSDDLYSSSFGESGEVCGK